MKSLGEKLLSLGVWTFCAAIALVIAGGTAATLGVARSVEAKVERVGGLVSRSNELNEGMRESLKPTEDLNRKAGVVGEYIRDTLEGMREMGEGLKAMVEALKANNAILALVKEHTDHLSAALGELDPYLRQLSSAVDEGNYASASSLDILEKINEVNAAIAEEMAALRDKLANSNSYRILFTYALPALP